MEITNKLKNLGVFKDFTDGSLKTVFDAGNNEIIEVSLLMNKETMDVVCVPTHHFCNLGCKMCNLTNQGLNKKMKAINAPHLMEAMVRTLVKPINPSLIHNQAFQIKDGDLIKRTTKKKLLISFMGVGEPLLNLDLIKEIYHEEKYLKKLLGYEEISYSLATMMPNDHLLKLTEIVSELDMPLKVHFSLHTPLDQARFDLIPASHVTLEEALSMLVNYRDVIQKNETIMKKYINFHRTNDPIEIHYTLIDQVNDGDHELEALTKLLTKYMIPIKFILFNPINDLKRSSNEEIWVEMLKEALPDLRIKTYAPPGKEIGSSCGEFTKHYYHNEIETDEELQEFEEWKKEHQLFENN